MQKGNMMIRAQVSLSVASGINLFDNFPECRIFEIRDPNNFLQKQNFRNNNMDKYVIQFQICPEIICFSYNKQFTLNQRRFYWFEKFQFCFTFDCAKAFRLDYSAFVNVLNLHPNFTKF